MFRLLTVAVAVSLACGIAASGAEAGCSLKVITSSVACPQPGDTKMGSCKRKLTTIVCDTNSQDLAKGNLPDTKLPSASFPESRMPESHLPD